MRAAEARFFADYFVDVMEREHPTTRGVIAAVPESRRDFRPDPRSRSAWELAVHIAHSELWFLDSIRAGSFVYEPGAEVEARRTLGTVTTLLDGYAEEFPTKLARVAAMSDEEWTHAVDFLGMFTHPRAAYLAVSHSHTVHHRGQLSAYLRSMGARVPSIYGPTADDADP